MESEHHEPIGPRNPHEAYTAFEVAKRNSEEKLGCKLYEFDHKKINTRTRIALNEAFELAHVGPVGLVDTLATKIRPVRLLPVEELPQAVLLPGQDDAKKRYFEPHSFSVVTVTGTGAKKLPAAVLSEDDMDAILVAYNERHAAPNSLLATNLAILQDQVDTLKRKRDASIEYIPTAANMLRKSVAALTHQVAGIVPPEDILELNGLVSRSMIYSPPVEVGGYGTREPLLSTSDGKLTVKPSEDEPRREATDEEWIQESENMVDDYIRTMPNWMRDVVKAGKMKDAIEYLYWSPTGPQTFRRELLDQLYGLSKIASPFVDMEIVPAVIKTNPGENVFTAASFGEVTAPPKYKKTEMLVVPDPVTLVVEGDAVVKQKTLIPEYPEADDVTAVAEILTRNHLVKNETELKRFAQLAKDAAVFLAHQEEFQDPYFSQFIETYCKVGNILAGQTDAPTDIDLLKRLQLVEPADDVLLFITGKPFNTQNTAKIPLHSNTLQAKREAMGTKASTTYETAYLATSINAQHLRTPSSRITDETDTLLVNPQFRDVQLATLRHLWQTKSKE